MFLLFINLLFIKQVSQLYKLIFNKIVIYMDLQLVSMLWYWHQCCGIGTCITIISGVLDPSISTNTCYWCQCVSSLQ